MNKITLVLMGLVFLVQVGRGRCEEKQFPTNGTVQITNPNVSLQLIRRRLLNVWSLVNSYVNPNSFIGKKGQLAVAFTLIEA